MHEEPIDVQIVDEPADDYEEDDDDENWVSSGVATPDDREEAEIGDLTPQTGHPPGLPAPSDPVPAQYQEQPLSEPIAGPSSVPAYESNALDQRRDAEEDDRFDNYPQHGGYKTAPSSRPPSVRRRRGPPSLIRTSSFTPALNTTAPPLTTTSIASAQITSTNPPEGGEDVLTPPAGDSPIHHYGRDSWGGIAPVRATSPGSIESGGRVPQSRSAFLPAKPTSPATSSSVSALRPGIMRNSTASSVSTVAAPHSPQLSPNPSLNAHFAVPNDYAPNDSRNRKGSTFSIASNKLGAVTSGVAGLFSRGSIPSIASPLNSEHSSHHPKQSAAMSSLQSIPKRRDTPPPLTSHFPPVSQLAHVAASGTAGAGPGGAGGMAFSLLPAPYMAAHMAVRTYEAPLQDAYARVMQSRPRAAPTGSR